MVARSKHGATPPPDTTTTAIFLWAGRLLVMEATVAKEKRVGLEEKSVGMVRGDTTSVEVYR